MNTPVLVTIVFMGDSVTAGQYVDPPSRWTDIVSARLTRTYLDTPVNLLLINKGVSGETTRQGLERFPADAQNAAPDLMTLQFGFNDCNCWVTDRGLPRVSEGAFRANLIEMIHRARHFGAKRIILSTNYPTLRLKILLSGESLEARRRRYDDIVRDVAIEEEVQLCEVAKTFETCTYSELEESLMPYPDQLHLSLAGHIRYADAVYGLISDAVTEIVSEKSEI